MKKITVLFLLFCLTMPLFGGCAGGGVPQNTTDNITEDTTTDAGTTDGGTTNPGNDRILVSQLTENGYTVVRPENSDTENIRIIKDGIEIRYSVSLDIKDDFFREGVPAFSKGEYEILIGKTNRDESIDFLSGLKYNDYGYAKKGNKIVIAGHTEEMTEKAIRSFLYFINHNNTDVLISDSDSYISRGEYPMNEISVNELDINNYTIVYPWANKNEELFAATMLFECVASKTGSIIKVENDKNEYSGGYEIIIGESSHVSEEMKENRTKNLGRELEADSYYIGVSGKRIWVSALSKSGIVSGVKCIIGLIDKEQTLPVNINIFITDGMTDLANVTETVRTMSFNVLTTVPDAARIERVISIIKTYNPDTIGFQEVSPTWISILSSRLGNEYGYVSRGRSGTGQNNDEASPVFYLKSKFKLIESATKWLSATPDKVNTKFEESSLPRIMTYALLEFKSDGTRFVFANAHLDHTSNTARTKQTEVLLEVLAPYVAEYPVILSGDFNCESNTTPYKTITDENFVNSATVAVTKRLYHTYHGSTTADSKNLTIDFIFTTNMNTVVDAYKVCNEMVNGEYPSDHFPIYCDYRIIK